MNPSKLLLPLLPALSTCAANPDPPATSVEVTVSEQREAGARAIPWSDGGRFTARVVAVAPNFVGAIPARVSLVNDRAPDAGGAPQSVVLTRLMPQGDRYAAPVPLAWAPGGPFVLRVEAVGVVQDFPFAMDVPRVGLSATVAETPPAAGSTLRRYDVCVETTARAGTLVVQVRRGRFAGDAAQLQQALERDACTQGSPLFPDEIEHTHVPLQVFAEGRDFLLSARLEGAAAPTDLTPR